jgi:hypothetical protein
MSSKPVVTAAVVQAGSILFDTARTLDKLADLASAGFLERTGTLLGAAHAG